MRHCRLIATALLAVATACSDASGPRTPNVRAFVVHPNPATVRVGETLVLVTTYDADSAADVSLSWRSGDPRKVEVSENGILTGVSVGGAVVTATSVANPSLVIAVPVTIAPRYSGVRGIALTPVALRGGVHGDRDELARSVGCDDRDAACLVAGHGHDGADGQSRRW